MGANVVKFFTVAKLLPILLLWWDCFISVARLHPLLKRVCINGGEALFLLYAYVGSNDGGSSRGDVQSATCRSAFALCVLAVTAVVYVLYVSDGHRGVAGARVGL